MTTTPVASIFRSPCCRTALTESAAGDVCCGACGSAYRRASYGLDLVPATMSRAHPAYDTWCRVQEALTAWRQRTWNQSATAAARTNDTAVMAVDFLRRAAVRDQVLDVGCGSGWIARLVEPAGRYHGVDPMPLAAAYPFPFARALSDWLPFADGSFDSVMFFSSLDYSLDPLLTLREARRVLRPGGVLAVATPVHLSRDVAGERLHHHRFLAGDVEHACEDVFGGSAQSWPYRDNYHFVWITRP
jgi:SAM-dependent methyltransferase